MYRLLILIVLISGACTPKSSKSNSKPLSFEGVEIPIQGTAIIGEIRSSEKMDSGLKLKVKVSSMKQGGAGTAYFEKDSEGDFYLSNNMIRIYEDQETLKGLLQTGSQILFITTRDLRSGQNSITQIIHP